MKKNPLKKIKDALWQECRVFFKRNYLVNDIHKCFTCSKPIEKSNCQLGHFIPSSVGGALLRYHPHNLRLQCYYCNINLGGNGSEFYKRLVIEKDQEYVDRLFVLKSKTTKADIIFYTKLKELYEEGKEQNIVSFLNR